MDEFGYIKCHVCGDKIRYTYANLMIYHPEVRFPLFFVKENNYFCCPECVYTEQTNPKFKEMMFGLSRVRIAYDDNDMIQAINKIEIKLKNHEGWIENLKHQ